MQRSSASVIYCSTPLQAPSSLLTVACRLLLPVVILLVILVFSGLEVCSLLLPVVLLALYVCSLTLKFCQVSSFLGLQPVLIDSYTIKESPVISIFACLCVCVGEKYIRSLTHCSFESVLTDSIIRYKSQLCCGASFLYCSPLYTFSHVSTQAFPRRSPQVPYSTSAIRTSLNFSCVLILLYMCPHTPTYVSSYSYMCAY